MANSFRFKDHEIQVGDMVEMQYRIKEGDKERLQTFKGFIIAVKGADPVSKSITIRRITRSGVGVERIVNTASPFIHSITVSKKTNYKTRSKIYFTRSLSDQSLRTKLYSVSKKAVVKRKSKSN